MTRDEFEENVNDFSELIDFCNHEGCEICSEVYDSYARDYDIEEHLAEWVRNDGWREVLASLKSHEDEGDYDYYICDDYGDFTGATEADFQEYKNNVRDWMDEGGYWDTDEEDEEDEEYEDEPYVAPVDPFDAIPTEREDCTFMEMFSECADSFRTIAHRAAQAQREEDASFLSFAF